LAVVEAGWIIYDVRNLLYDMPHKNSLYDEKQNTYFYALKKYDY
jgi:hypothetical protein